MRPSSAYDLIVIGGGPAGYPAAIHAAGQGRRVCLVERGEIGGTCLNRGCVPTKTLLHAGQLLDTLRQAENFGVRFGGEAALSMLSIDEERLQRRKVEIVRQMATGIDRQLKAAAVDRLSGAAVIPAPGRVRVGERELAAEYILIATGSEPVRPDFPGSESGRVLTADQFLSRPFRLPASVLLVGGGVIGVEFAEIFASSGSRVTVVEAQSRLLPMMDREIAQTVQMKLKKRGVQIFTEGQVEAVSEGASAVSCRLNRRGESLQLEANLVLTAVGRRACTEGLFADTLPIHLTANGAIPADPSGRTEIPGIHAAGDVTEGNLLLAHAATAQGINAVCDMFGRPPQYDLSAVPVCLYTSPETATVGLTPQQAREQGIAVQVGKYLMTGSARNQISGGGRGFIRLVFEAETERLLGAQIAGERATDLIAAPAFWIGRGASRSEIASVVFPHPGFAEGFTEAALAAAGSAVLAPTSVPESVHP